MRRVARVCIMKDNEIQTSDRTSKSRDLSQLCHGFANYFYYKTNQSKQC